MIGRPRWSGKAMLGPRAMILAVVSASLAACGPSRPDAAAPMAGFVGEPVGESGKAAAARLAERAEAARAAGRMREAVRLASDAAAIDPALRPAADRAREAAALALVASAEEALARDRTMLARVRASEAAMIAPRLSEPPTLLARIEAREEAARTFAADRAFADHVAEGRRHLAEARFDHAASRFRRALELRNDDEVRALLDAARVADHRRRAYLAIARGDRMMAIHHLELLLAIRPDETAAHVLEDLHTARGRLRR
jgi:tetratricopeptide (TPR) repeat protein